MCIKKCIFSIQVCPVKKAFSNQNDALWGDNTSKEVVGTEIKGFTMNDEKLKNLGGGDYWHELLERIRDIR